MIRSGCVQGLHSFHLVSGGFLMRFKVIKLWLSLSLWNILQFVRVIAPHKNSKILLCISLRRNQDPDPSLHYWFLAALPHLCIFSVIWLATMRTCLLGLRSWVMESVPCKHETGDRKASLPRDPTGFCSVSLLINMCLCSSYRTFLGLSFSSLKRGFYEYLCMELHLIISRRLQCRVHHCEHFN